MEMTFVFLAGLLESSMLEIWASLVEIWACSSFRPGSTVGAFLREEPLPVHLAQGLGVGGFVPAPFNQYSNAWRKQKASGTAKPGLGIPGFVASLD